MLNSMFRMYIATNRLSDATDVFKKMKLEKFDPGIQTYTSLIKANGEIGRLDLSMNLFEEMIQKNIQPNNITFLVLLNACAKHNDVTNGVKVIQYMSKRDIVVDEKISTAMIAIYGKANMINEAFNIFQKIKTPDRVTCIAMLEACIETGDAEKGHKVHRIIVEKSTGVIDSKVYTSLIKMYGSQNQIESAIAVFREMIRMKCSPNHITCLVLLNACAKEKNIKIGDEVM
ncbi:pentatricopeptide repeat-containing protein, partial [Acrasis kona]